MKEKLRIQICINTDIKKGLIIHSPTTKSKVRNLSIRLF